ncbi:MAG: heme-binding beta-barrel domain-containing protein [Acidimicrobiales bacterium]
MSRTGRPMDVPLHPLLLPVAFLLGSWEGEGRGLWTDDPVFRYRERVEFTHCGGPFITYHQWTSTLDGSRPLHTESGYLRAGSDHRIELVVTQPTGIVEIHTGRLTGQLVELHSTVVARTPTALNVTGVSRTVEVDGGVLTYRLHLSMNHEASAPHLEARLERAIQPSGSWPEATVENPPQPTTARPSMDPPDL